jgi:RNA polymerase sigma-70 factor, ECF subfamily
VTETGELFSDVRALLFSIAYRMLSSVAEAEDIVQEAFVRYERAVGAGRGPIESPKAYLSTVTTRLAINHLRSARVRREQYVGEWQPEPLITDETALEGARYVEQSDSLSMAFLLVLERLTPVERAVFLLHDVFDYGYGEVAHIVGRTEDNCRQLAARARRHVSEEKVRFDASQAQRDELAERFFAAIEGRGDIDDLVALLAADVVAYGDGGGKAPAARRAIHGRERVAKMMRGFVEAHEELGIRTRHTNINGQPGAIFFDRSARVIAVMVLDISDGQVQVLRWIANPDKTAHLGPRADFQALTRQLAQRNQSG